MALTLLFYFPAWRGGVIWDDGMRLARSPHIQSPTVLPTFWFTAKAPQYLPLTQTTLWIEWRFWNLNTTGYHIVNISLRAGGAFLFWRVLRQLKTPFAFLSAA